MTCSECQFGIFKVKKNKFWGLFHTVYANIRYGKKSDYEVFIPILNVFFVAESHLCSLSLMILSCND